MSIAAGTIKNQPSSGHAATNAFSIFLSGLGVAAFASTYHLKMHHARNICVVPDQYSLLKQEPPHWAVSVNTLGDKEWYSGQYSRAVMQSTLPPVANMKEYIGNLNDTDRNAFLAIVERALEEK